MSRTVTFIDTSVLVGYLIESTGLPGFEPRELELVALIARWHRKGEPDPSALGELERKGDADRLMLLGGVIRLAEQLERSRDGSVVGVELEKSRELRHPARPDRRRSRRGHERRRLVGAEQLRSARRRDRQARRGGAPARLGACR